VRLRDAPLKAVAQPHHARVRARQESEKSITETTRFSFGFGRLRTKELSVNIVDSMTKVGQSSARICFITVPVDTDVSPVTKSLKSRGIECTRRDRFDWSTTLDTLTDLIRNSDFVCAFSPSTLPPNLLFEIGIAIGMRKPIFMVLPKDARLPEDLRSIDSISADQWKAEIIEPHLDAFLETLPKKSPRGSQRKKRTVGRFDFSREREELAHLEKEASPRELELFVENLFRKAAINVTQSPLTDFGADFALSSPSINRRFGNPILVEIKHSSLGSDLSFAADRLAHLIANRRGSIALLVTLQPVSPQSKNYASSVATKMPIYFFTVKELIDSLEVDGLIDKLWDYRNQKYHSQTN
jgi:restriction endonuclease